MKKLLSIILMVALCITAIPLSFIGCGKIDVEKFVYPAFEKLQDLNKYAISVSYTKENKNCVETRMFETVLEKDFSYYKRTEDNLTVVEVWFEDRGEEKTNIYNTNCVRTPTPMIQTPSLYLAHCQDRVFIVLLCMCGLCLRSSFCAP